MALLFENFSPSPNAFSETNRSRIYFSQNVSSLCKSHFTYFRGEILFHAFISSVEKSIYYKFNYKNFTKHSLVCEIISKFVTMSNHLTMSCVSKSFRNFSHNFLHFDIPLKNIIFASTEFHFASYGYLTFRN